MTHFIQQGHTYSISSNATPWASIFKPPKRENNKISLRTCYRKKILVKVLESQTRMDTSHYCWSRSVAWLRDQLWDELTLNHAFVVTCHNNNSLSLETLNAQPMASNVEKIIIERIVRNRFFSWRSLTWQGLYTLSLSYLTPSLNFSSQLHQILNTRSHQEMRCHHHHLDQKRDRPSQLTILVTQVGFDHTPFYNCLTDLLSSSSYSLG